MKKLILVLFMVLCFSSVFSPEVYCNENGWTFTFFGIDHQDIKDRKIVPIVIGLASSFVVHELGHFAFGELVGMDTRWEDDVVMAYDYWDKSDDQKALFHGGGFLAQFIVGGALTAIPQTRHSDFNVGFNAFTFYNSAVYAITGGVNTKEEYSDIHNLSDHGYNGELVGGLSSLSGGIFTYIALDKVKGQGDE